jgi:tripartite-type tricarboxylate transporter receptor subunit TctC
MTTSHMTTSITRRQAIVGAASGLMASNLLAQAGYPNRPIRYICPWPAGGSTDAVVRAICDSASKTLGQPIVVDNKAGAGGSFGANELVSAKPDGYTIAQLPHIVFRMPHMQKTQFDTLKDFTWIACLTGYTFGLVVPTSSPFKTIKDYVDYARANPEKLSYGHTGLGTSPHLAMEEFAQKAGIKLTNVPFKGNADNMQAILGGHTMSASDATGWGPHVESGKLRLLATYGSKRTKRWPTVATLDELGYKTVSDSPFGVCGPKGMDAGITKIIHDAFKKTLEDPAVLAVFDKFDQTIIYKSTAEYTQFAKDSFVNEKALIERLGLANKG